MQINAFELAVLSTILRIKFRNIYIYNKQKCKWG